MAKRPLKAIDPLAIGLEQLAIADRDATRAVRFLCKALLSPVVKPTFTICKFTIGDKTYKARLTSAHCQAILDVVSQGGNVQVEVGTLLGQLSFQIDECIDGLMDQLNVTATSAMATAALAHVALGCCIYNGGQTAHLSQAQCNQYNPVSWDPGNADCSREPLI